MSAQRILIFIPTYNERDNVERMARELAALDLDADILFLDDGSPDGTGHVLDSLARDIPRLDVVHREGKQGIGSAHQVGIARAYAGGYDVLVTLDCDFTHDPSDIPRMLEALRGHDVAVGSRYMRRGSLPGWNLARRCLTLFGHFLTSTLLGVPQDASGAFRAYDLKRVRPEFFSLVTSRSYSFFFESLFVLARNGLAIKEIPIVLPARTYGSSKLTAREALRGGMYLLRLWLESLAHPERFRLGRRPDALLDQPGDTDWDAYWTTKSGAGGLAYELVAALYRKVFIRPNLERAVRKTFAPGSALLHAGCGAGQADAALHALHAVTAVDLSRMALELYARNNPGAARVEQADIFRLPFEEGRFDGVFNLGVMEHFTEDQAVALLVEFRRVLRPGGKVLLFWPHVHATSGYVIKAIHWVMHRVLGKTGTLHPDEITLLAGEPHARRLLEAAGFELAGYEFGWRDFFVQAVVTGVPRRDR